MKRLLIMILCVVATLSFSITATFCLDVERAEDWYQSESDDYTDISLWGQALEHQTKGRYLQCGKSDESVWYNACSYYAAAFMLAKMGKLDVANGENPVTVLDRMEAVDPVGELWGIMNYNKIGLAFDGVRCDAAEFDKNLLGYSFTEVVDMIRQKMAEGFFIIICVGDGCSPGGHYIFVDDVTDDGDLIIGDSYYEGRRWSDTLGPSGCRVYYWDVFSCEDIKPEDCPGIYEIHDMIASEREAEAFILDAPESVNSIRLEQLLSDNTEYGYILY